MNDHTVEALTHAGLSPSPLGILEYANSFFALYADKLVYGEETRLSTVGLPDVTRIHSDREGVLRVETSERTAITASLLGYDPGQVQQFFQQVRDVTARAKELPVMPLNRAAKSEPALSPVVATTLPPTPTPSMPAAPDSTPSRAPAAAPSVPPYSSGSSTSLPPVTPLVSSTSVPVVPSAAMPRPDVGTAESPLRPEPLVISSMPAVHDIPPPRKSAPAVVRIQSGGTLGEPGSPVLSAALSSAATPDPVPTSAPSMAPVPQIMGLSLTGRDLLRARAESVQRFSGSVRLLAIVLGLAALGLAIVQYRNDQTISAVWTLLTGGVGMVALLAFAEALRLLAALGTELGAGDSGRE
ncbi:hypothetical protein MF271_07680 [Deinococcus sp. KNUC1210]|uniref:hypothetical protein n=1 Tax=Deinococcus sp. KNUC1210 TaxID=2917691 RepID=UPI001EF09C63|nr:hypothetical protein [Deinococcus sp. KNUC1210]ULH16450.1 hypothetical protein MF271_07680 [Deinococcus sp. KNUC1210]